MAIYAWGHDAEHGDIPPHWIKQAESERPALLRKMQERVKVLTEQLARSPVNGSLGVVDATVFGATDIVDPRAF
jgi:hypothetical protein